MHDDWRLGIGASWLLLLAYGFVRILLHPTALRDPSPHSPRPYSLSRVQLWWWTLVIIGTWFTLWSGTGTFAPFNATALTLMGLSGSASVAARLIDGRDADTQASQMHQCQASSEGFFVDILSDASGVSMHRFQTLLFQVAYAFAFVSESLKGWEFPTFDRFTLALLGFSTGTYTAVKATENRPTPVLPPPIPEAANGLEATTPSSVPPPPPAPPLAQPTKARSLAARGVTPLSGPNS
jgi:hypothetical protein